ncbi:unnamed protein product [Mytilus edulis]|uniref:B box-type domain-containing protein n=1 Tax=Mytilus edulis TaxID=6550 RepID=A0A8S3QZN6_MYTED|nr:unnamed protein product [Mytilus edulis]
MESICNPCERRNIVSKLTHWCSDCEDGLCEKCLKDHRAIKLTQHHHVTEMTELSIEKAKLLLIPECDKHPGCKEDFICLEHDLICCHTCLQSDHKDCNQVSNVNILAKGIRKSEMYLANRRTMQEVRKAMKGIDEERQSAKEGVIKQQQRIRMEIANTKSKFMEHINNLENVLLHELSKIEKENNILIEEEITALLKTEKEIKEDEQILQFIANNGSESRLFSFLKKQRRKQENTIGLLEEIPPASKVLIKFGEASHELDAIKAIGFISVHYEIVNSGKVRIPSTNEKYHNNAAQTNSNQRRHTSLTSTECLRHFPMLKETLQIQLDPKDFVERNEKYRKLNLIKVCLAVKNDNYLLIVGHVNILEEHTEENKLSKYKNNYRVVKYMFDDKGLTYINGRNIYCDLYYESNYNYDHDKMELSCIPKSTQAVLLYQTRRFELLDSESMERQWCLELGHEFKALATDEKFIYIASGDMLYKYNRIGCLMDQTTFIHCNWFGLSLNGNFACRHGRTFCLLKADCSKIFSYRPAHLKRVTIDNTGNIYLATRDGIQLLDPLKMETDMVYRYDKKIADGLQAIVCNRVKHTLFLIGKQSTKKEEFGKHRCNGSLNSCSENSRTNYVCLLCNYRTDSYSYNRCEGLRDRILDSNKFVIKVLTK